MTHGNFRCKLLVGFLPFGVGISSKTETTSCKAPLDRAHLLLHLLFRREEHAFRTLPHRPENALCFNFSRATKKAKNPCRKRPSLFFLKSEIDLCFDFDKKPSRFFGQGAKVVLQIKNESAFQFNIKETTVCYCHPISSSPFPK